MFKETRNRFQPDGIDSWALYVCQPGGIDSLKSIPGLLKRFKNSGSNASWAPT